MLALDILSISQSEGERRFSVYFLFDYKWFEVAAAFSFPCTCPMLSCWITVDLVWQGNRWIVSCLDSGPIDSSRVLYKSFIDFTLTPILLWRNKTIILFVSIYPARAPVHVMQ